MTDPARPEQDESASLDSQSVEVMELLRRRASERGRSLKWNTNTLLLTYVILAIITILDIRGVNTLFLAAVAVVGLALIWAFSRFQGRRLEKAFLKEEMRVYADLLSATQRRGGTVVADPSPELEYNTQSPLTGRELEILKLIALGKTNKETAVELQISQQTVKNHISHIFAKLEVNDRTSAVLIAMRSGWIQTTGPGTLDKTD